MPWEQSELQGCPAAPGLLLWANVCYYFFLEYKMTVLFSMVRGFERI